MVSKSFIKLLRCMACKVPGRKIIKDYTGKYKVLCSVPCINNDNNKPKEI
jgi:hypothetical protein